MCNSEIARILAQIDMEYEAARSGLQGLSCGASTHQFLIARAERIAILQESLCEQVGDQNEAMRLWLEHQEPR